MNVIRRRGKTKQPEKGLMDPLWEFILDDADDSVAERAAWRSKGTSQQNRRAAVNKEPSFLGGLFGYDSDSSDDSPYENRDESSNKRTGDTRDTSVWDFFGDGSHEQEMNTATKVQKKPTNSKAKKSSTRGRNSTSKSTPRLDATSRLANEKRAKKSGLFQRLRRKDASTRNVQNTPKSQKLSVVKPVNKTTSNKYKSAPSSILKKTEKQDSDTAGGSTSKEDGLNPFQLFSEMAEALDPFASDGSDSDSIDTEAAASRQPESVVAEKRDAPEHTHRGDVAEMDRLVERARSNSNLQEIRLNFKPVAEEHYGAEGEDIDNSHGSDSDHDRYENPYNFEENSIAESSREARSVDASGTVHVSELVPIQENEINGRSFSRLIDTPIDTDRKINTEKEDDMQSIVIARNTPADKMPTTNGTQYMAVPRLEHSEALLKKFDNKSSKKNRSLSLRRLACCSVKARDEKVLSESKLPFPPKVLPLPAAQKQSNQKSTPVNVGNTVNKSIKERTTDVTSNEQDIARDSELKVVENEGPQSVYDYDYDSQENLDVFYTAMGLKPRSSIVVRKLGGPPPLIVSEYHDEVIVKIQASTVSETDCLIRQGMWWGTERVPVANTPGAEMAGKIFEIKPTVARKSGLRTSQTVLSLTKWGGNGRFISIDPSKLVKVPLGIDPADAVCLPETYLTAFQVLHLGQNLKTRYTRSSLRGKSILIVGSMANNMGKAVIELALNAGVANIYATAKEKHWKTLISFGVMPLNPNPETWIDRVDGTIDLVLASNGGLREDISATHFRALRPKTGKLVMCGRRIVGNDVPTGSSDQSPASLVCAKNKEFAKMLHRSHNFDIYEQWERNLELCKKDLTHLLKLVQQGNVKPKILDRIPLSKVARAHELLESKRLSGFLICEPWMKSKKRAVYL